MIERLNQFPTDEMIPMTEDPVLRATVKADLEVFFRQQLDPDARYMAAFTAPDPHDYIVFITHWENVLLDQALIKRTILYGGQVAGHIVGFQQFGNPSVGYWLGKDFWRQGIMTRALALFLAQIPTRPLYARVVKDNHASRRVLEKCGFVICGEDRGYANARQMDVEEYILRLDPSDQHPSAPEADSQPKLS